MSKISEKRKEELLRRYSAAKPSGTKGIRPVGPRGSGGGMGEENLKIPSLQ